jgi:DNA-binding transcriptional regulator GbsR (MarR family)
MIINNQFLAKVLWLSKSEVSKSLKKLSEKNILSYKYIIDQKFLIPNEDITSWKVENSQDKLVKIETMRIFMAKRNVQLRDSYQDMLKKKEAILEQSKCAMIKLKTSL